MMSYTDVISYSNFYRRNILNLYAFLASQGYEITQVLFESLFQSYEYFIITVERMYQFRVVLLAS